MSLTINSFGNNSISSLFGGSSSSSNSIFGGLESSLTSLSQIKTGSYGKLVKAYYDKYDNDGNLKTETGKKAKTDTSKLSSIRNDTADLNKATDKLLAKGKDSIWNQVEKTDEDGNVTKEYDKDAIYKAVSDFATKYNNLVDSGQKSESTAILSQIAGMVTGTAKTSTTLAKAGITIDSNNHLNVDEDFLKNKANMTYVKDLFNGTGSYAYQVATKASMANSYASTDLSKITGRKSYTNKGSFDISADDMVKAFDTTT
jgi:major membrane immunogen (membrane-anchored lipoprotein)